MHAQDAQRKQCNCCRDPENGGPDQVLVEAQVPAKEQGRRLGLITSGPGTKVRSEGQERPPRDGMSVASGRCGTPAPLEHTTLEHIHEFCERADSSHSFAERESWLCGREPVQCVQCEVVACVDRVRVRRGGLCASLGCVWLGCALEILNVFTFHPTLEKRAARGVTRPVCLDRSICMARPRLWMLHWARVWAEGRAAAAAAEAATLYACPGVLIAARVHANSPASAAASCGRTRGVSSSECNLRRLEPTAASAPKVW